MALRIADQATSKQLAIAPTLAQAKLVFERAKWMLSALGILWTSITTPHPSIRVTTPDKPPQILHILDARSGHDAKNLRGEGADHILLDEAAFMPESLATEVAMPMLAAQDEGRMTLISTPRGKNYFYRYFKAGQEGRHGFWSRRSPSWENPRVSKEYIELQMEILNEHAFRTEYGCEFLDIAAAVFSGGAIEAALSAPRIENGRVFAGMDWARRRDYTAVVALRGLRTGAEVIAIERWSHMRWADQVEHAAELIRDLSPDILHCDATGMGDSPTEDLRARLPGIRVQEFVFSRKTKTELIQNLSVLLEKGLLRLPSHPELLRELENYECAPTEFGARFSAPSGMHDDLVCALALACWGLPASRELGILGIDR